MYKNRETSRGTELIT